MTLNKERSSLNALDSEANFWEEDFLLDAFAAMTSHGIVDSNNHNDRELNLDDREQSDTSKPNDIDERFNAIISRSKPLSTNQCNSSNRPHKFRVGSACQAMESKIGEIRDAHVIRMDIPRERCIVRFFISGNEEEFQLNQLLPPRGASSKVHNSSDDRPRHKKNVAEIAENDLREGRFREDYNLRLQESRDDGDVEAYLKARGLSDHHTHKQKPSSRRHNNYSSGSEEALSSSHIKYNRHPMPDQHFSGVPYDGQTTSQNSNPSRKQSTKQRPEMCEPSIIPPSFKSLLNQHQTVLRNTGYSNDDLESMLMSWYMCGYHTGYYEGFNSKERFK